MEPNSNQKDASARTKQERPELLTSKNRFRALLDINNAIISILNKQDLFHAIAKTLKENFPVDCTAVTLYNEKKDVFEVLSIEPFFSSVELYSGFEMPHKDVNSISDSLNLFGLALPILNVPIILLVVSKGRTI